MLAQSIPALLCLTAVSFAAEKPEAENQAGPSTSSSESAAISVRAGFLRFWEGEVTLVGVPQNTKNDGVHHLENGKTLRTNHGRAELTLNVGSYLRAGPDTELEMIQAGIESARLRLDRGEVIADIRSISNGKTSTIAVGESLFQFQESGIYKISAPGDSSATLTVLRGRAECNGTVVAKGDSCVVDSGGQTQVDKASTPKGDSLLAWNKQRRKTIQLEDAPRQRVVGESGVDREVRHMGTNRPVGTKVVGPD